MNLLALLLAMCLLPGSDDADVGIWRNTNHAGSNALFLFLKIHGESPSAEAIEELEYRRGNPTNISDLLGFAKDLGYQLEARQISPDDFSKLPLPAIVHLDSDNVDKGYITLLLQVDAHRVIYMDGGSASVSTMNREHFLRQWTGVAVIPKNDSATSNYYTVACLLAAFATPYLFFRRRRNHAQP